MSSASTDKTKVPVNRQPYGMSSMSKYQSVSKLGQGTFGEVVKGRNKEDHKLVALKSIIVHNQKGGYPITALREVTIMKRLKNKNVLQLIDIVCQRDTKAKGVKKLPTFYMVMPYMPYDLSGLLTNPRVHLTHSHIKCLMQQLLEGINYIHEQHYFHRDIKAANILVGHRGTLKIADFGLARNYEGPSPKRGSGPCGSTRRYTGLVVTRWYRAPELLLGNQRYTTAIDLWGVGCVFAEMFEKNPILQGKSDLDQGRIIFELVGPPTQGNWKDYDKLPQANQFVFPASRRNLEVRFQKMGQQGVSLLDGLLKLDPRFRLNALDALDHPYFTTNPLPCKPIELPKFEESHEMDADKFREEEKKLNNKLAQDEKWSAPESHGRPPVNPSLPRMPNVDSRYPSRPAAAQNNMDRSRAHNNGYNRPTEPLGQGNRYRSYERSSYQPNGRYSRDHDSSSGPPDRRPHASLPDIPDTSYRSGYNNATRSSYQPYRPSTQNYPNKRPRFEDQNQSRYNYQDRSEDHYRARKSETTDRDRTHREEDIKIDYSDEIYSKEIRTKSRPAGPANGKPAPPPKLPPPPRPS